MNYAGAIIFLLIGFAAFLFSMRYEGLPKKITIGFGALVFAFGAFRIYEAASEAPIGSVDYYITHKEERTDLSVRCSLAPEWVNKKEMGCDRVKVAEEKTQSDANKAEFKEFK